MVTGDTAGTAAVYNLNLDQIADRNGNALVSTHEFRFDDIGVAGMNTPITFQSTNNVFTGADQAPIVWMRGDGQIFSRVSLGNVDDNVGRILLYAKVNGDVNPKLVVDIQGTTVAIDGDLTITGAVDFTGTTSVDFTGATVTGLPAAYSDSDVDTHLNTGSAGTNEVLSWTGSDYDWVAQSGGGSGLQSRSTATGTTSSLADAAQADLDITGFKAYALLTITTDRAARVRLYVTAATRTADASRAEGVDPTSDAGLIAEVITTGAETVIISPGAYGFNLESSPTTTIPCRVTNKSGGTSTVQVDLNILQLEA